MFKRAYEIAQDLGNPIVIENARIQLGIANGHLILSGFSTTMNNVCKTNIQKILGFKSSRLDSFTDGEQDVLLHHDSQSRVEVHLESESQDSAQESGIQETNEAEVEESAKEQPSEEENSGTEAKENAGSDSGITSELEEEKTESS